MPLLPYGSTAVMAFLITEMLRERGPNIVIITLLLVDSVETSIMYIEAGAIQAWATTVHPFCSVPELFLVGCLYHLSLEIS